jgi:hypothetical protein
MIIKYASKFCELIVEISISYAINHNHKINSLLQNSNKAVEMGKEALPY